MGGKAHHTHFPSSLLQFFSSPPVPTATTLTSCFLPGPAATKRPKNKSLDFSWTQFCHHCSSISCLFVQLNLAFSIKSSQWVRAWTDLRNSPRQLRETREAVPSRVEKRWLNASKSNIMPFLCLTALGEIFLHVHDVATGPEKENRNLMINQNNICVFWDGGTQWIYPATVFSVSAPCETA